LHSAFWLTLNDIEFVVFSFCLLVGQFFSHNCTNKKKKFNSKIIENNNKKKKKKNLGFGKNKNHQKLRKENIICLSTEILFVFRENCFE